jgi:hypothetical protein
MKLAALFFLLLSPLASGVRNSSVPVNASQNVSVAQNSTALGETKQKKDPSSDLDALDAAMEKLPAAPVTSPKPAPKPAPKKTPPKPVAKHVAPKAAPKKAAQALNVPSKEDVKLSDLAKKNKDFAIKDDADAVLEAGDALAEKAEKEKHREELKKVAPAKVVNVDAPATKPDDNENLESAKTLASDLEGLKERAAEQKAEKIEDQKRHETFKRNKLKVKAIKDKRAQRKSQAAPKDKKKQRALNLDKLVKLTDEIKKKTSFVQKQAPVETHSTLEAHAGKLEEAQQEVDEMKANGKISNATPAASGKDDVKSPEPPVPNVNTQAVAPSSPARKITSASHHPENTEHLKNINEAVGHLSEEETPASVKEVQEVLEKAQAITKPAKNSTVAQFAADPHQAKVRAKKFKNKMESHVDEMHQALHEHQKAVDTKIHLEKIRQQREVEAAERLKWEAEQARLEQLKIQAEKLQHEKEEKEKTEAIENRTATEAAHKSFDPQAEFRAKQMRKPQAPPPRSSAFTMGQCSLVLTAVAAFFA